MENRSIPETRIDRNYGTEESESIENKFYFSGQTERFREPEPIIANVGLQQLVNCFSHSLEGFIHNFDPTRIDCIKLVKR